MSENNPTHCGRCLHPTHDGPCPVLVFYDRGPDSPMGNQQCMCGHPEIKSVITTSQNNPAPLSEAELASFKEEIIDHWLDDGERPALMLRLYSTIAQRDETIRQLQGDPEAVHQGAVAAIEALKQAQSVTQERDQLREDNTRMQKQVLEQSEVIQQLREQLAQAQRTIEVLSDNQTIKAISQDVADAQAGRVKMLDCIEGGCMKANTLDHIHALERELAEARAALEYIARPVPVMKDFRNLEQYELATQRELGLRTKHAKLAIDAARAAEQKEGRK